MTPIPTDPTAPGAVPPMMWADAAACHGMDTELFFPVEGGGSIIDPAAEGACRVCTVRALCLQWALEHERLGYWAGTSERQRRRLRRTLGIRLVDPPTTPATILDPSTEDLAS